MKHIHLATDLDRGLEFCENWVLAEAPQHAGALLQQELSNNSLLEDLTPRERQMLLTLGQPREVAKGEALFLKGDKADGVWLLEQGFVSILSGGEHSTRFSTLGPGQFLGEMSLIDGKRRSATALADSPVRALLLDQDAIATLAQQEPDAVWKIMRNIARYLSYRMRSASELLAVEAVTT